MEALLGKSLKISKGGEVETSSLSEPQTICLYFSGSFCGPCKKFTEYLDMFYEEINSDGYNMEIVLIPADEKEKNFTGKLLTVRVLCRNALEESTLRRSQNQR